VCCIESYLKYVVSSQYVTSTSRHEGYARPLFEYDRSENHNDDVNILAGARRTEREAKGVSVKPISHRSN
jgi:hypothetical protein